MELSENTIDVLKNFATVNPSIIIQQGNTLKTFADAQNLLAEANIIEEIPQDLAIYDLNQFLGVLSLVDQPKLKFNDDHLVIGDISGRSRTKYFYSDPEMLTSSDKDVQMPEADVKFELSSDVLNKIKRAASTLQHSELCITGDNGVVTLSIDDQENSTSNAYSIDVPAEFDIKDFKFIINIGSLKMLPGDYDVSISTRLISEFKHKEDPVKYWVALEKSSTY